MTYTWLTLLCYFFDSLAFMFQFRWFGAESHAKHETILMLSAIMFWVLSVLLFSWLTVVRYRLPTKYGQNFERMVMGFTNELEKKAANLYSKIRRREQPG